jgi:hypothetical protein
MKIFVRVNLCDVIPTGYGFAYDLPSELACVCAPIPLNLLVGLWRKLWCRLVRGISPDALDLAYRRGVEDAQTLQRLRHRKP